jgi:hypothetical protein
MDRIDDFLDRYVLPWPVRYLTFRFVILATLALLIPLILFASNQTLVLLVNSYLNTMSVAVSSIVLLYATVNEVRQKQIADLQEKRAQEDHQHVTEMHQLVLESLQNQHEEIHQLQEVLAAMQGKAYTPESLTPVPDLKDLHPRGAERFAEGDALDRLSEELHQNVLTETLRQAMIND